MQKKLSPNQNWTNLYKNLISECTENRNNSHTKKPLLDLQVWKQHLELVCDLRSCLPILIVEFTDLIGLHHELLLQLVCGQGVLQQLNLQPGCLIQNLISSQSEAVQPDSKDIAHINPKWASFKQATPVERS